MIKKSVSFDVDLETELGALGDCILHKTHHAMTNECWDRVINEWVDIMMTKKHRFVQESRDWYKWRYEQALLADLILAEYEEEDVD